jgi:hypothetical protein
VSDCTRCGRAAQNAFICRYCADMLREQLTDLPSWMGHLAESALGQTKLGDGGRRSKGDESPIRFNSRASELYAELHTMLLRWVKSVAEQQGGMFGTPTMSSSVLAGWLAKQVRIIALCETAGDMCDDVQDAIERIEKVVDRPVPMRFLGQCPTWVEETRTVCGMELRCRADAPEVFCRACKQTHNPDRLQLLMMNDLERKKLTFDKIREVNRMQPADYRIHERTLRHWRQTGRLPVRGYRRPDGREGISRHSEDDEPLFLWRDVRRLRSDRKASA